MLNNKEKQVSLILRIALAFSFIYASISSFINPISWIGFFPNFLRNIFSDSLLLNSFSIFEVFLGIWLLIGKKLFYS